MFDSGGGIGVSGGRVDGMLRWMQNWMTKIGLGLVGPDATGNEDGMSWFGDR